MAPLIAQGATVFLAGDLNARLGSDLVQGFEAAGLEFAPIAGSTYHFNRGLNLFGAIDHLAATPDAVRLRAPGVLREKFGSSWPSDHYPIFADYRLPK
ncbi:MAG: endonuclease/exonuclease/phosphatase family protein [Pseudorhodobacter sp.]